MSKSNAKKLAMAHLRKSGKRAAASGTQVDGSTLQERAMLIRFHVGRWYGSGADLEATEGLRKAHKAEGDIGTFTKRYMQREALAGIARVTNEARKYHKLLTLPWLDKLRILSAEMFFDYKETMSQFEVDFNQEVSKFLSTYDEQVKKEKQRLGTLFKETDYPTKEALRDRFQWEVRVEPIPSAEDFRVNLGSEQMGEIRKQIEEELQSAMGEAMTSLWQRMYALVKSLRDAMKESEGGVRKALFENLKEAVALMPRLNIAGDPKLNAITARITKDLLAEDVSAVRGDALVKSNIAKKADAILNSMSSFIGTGDADEE